MDSLTDEELSELHSFLHEHTLYGPDEIVYTSEGDTIRSVYHKVSDEAKRRGFWWAK